MNGRLIGAIILAALLWLALVAAGAILNHLWSPPTSSERSIPPCASIRAALAGGCAGWLAVTVDQHNRRQS